MAVIWCYGAVVMIALLNTVIEAGPYYEAGWPKECDGLKYCSVMPRNYYKYQKTIDYEIIATGLNKTRKIQDNLYNIGQERLGGDRENCNFVKKMIKPFVVREDSKWKLIVQSKFFEQKIETTECAKEYSNATLSRPDKHCFTAMQNSDDITFNCRTRQTAIKMYIFNIESKSIESVSLEIPVCCYCDVQSIYDKN